MALDLVKTRIIEVQNKLATMELKYDAVDLIRLYKEKLL